MSSSAFNTNSVWPRSVRTIQVLGVANALQDTIASIFGTNSRAREGLDDDAARRLGELRQARDVDHFMATARDQRHAFIGRGQGKGAHRHHAVVAAAVGEGELEAAARVLAQGEIVGHCSASMRACAS